MVEIKKLEWREAGGGNVCLIATARTPFGSYFIESDAEGFVLTLNHIGLLPHPTFAAAKAAAQQDYETRILSALVNAQADADVVERWQPISLKRYEEHPDGGGMREDELGAYVRFEDIEAYIHHAENAEVRAEDLARRIWGYFKGDSTGGTTAMRWFDNNMASGGPSHLIELCRSALSSLRPAEVGSATETTGTGGGE